MTAMQIDPAIQAAAQAMTRGFPVEFDIAAAAVQQTRTRGPGGPSAQIKNLDEPIFHRVDHVSATQAAAVKYTFFNENAADFITNLNNGTIDQQSVFALYGIGLDLVTGFTRLGAVSGAGAAFSPDATVAEPNPFTIAEAYRRIMKLGIFVLKVGNDELLRITGLDKLPLGCGLDGFAASSTTTAATDGMVASVCNGVPHVANVRRISQGPHLLMAGQKLHAEILLPSTTVAGLGTAVYGHWDLALFGTRFSK